VEALSAQLSSIVCGRCNTSLSELSKENNIIKYRCKCGRTSRIILNCIHCQKQFPILPYLIRKTNYCSQNCYWTGNNKKQLKTCQVCHKEFRIKSYLAKQGFGLYCSKKCWFSLFDEWKKKVKCRQCKKEFLVLRSVYKKNPGFCGKTCKDDFERDYVLKICQGCKQSFQIPRSDVSRGRGAFCTWECFKKYKGETSIEKLVRLELIRLNESFQQEARFGRFRADFFLPNKKIIIECDGDYWHRDEKSKERDKRKDALLKELGYKIIRINESEIRKNISNLDILIVSAYT